MSQSSSRETSDMDIDDESFDQVNQHATSSIVLSQSFLSNDSDTASVKSVNELIVEDKNSQEYYTGEESSLYGELYDKAQGDSSATSKPNIPPEEESLMEKMSIDDDSFLKTKENVNPTKLTGIITNVTKDYPLQKRLYQKQDNI